MVRGFEPGDAVAAYEVTEDAFDEWQERRRSYPEWARMTVEHAEFVPNSSPVAMVDGRMVGVVVSHGERIETVAVHRDFRGRGLARTLLRSAFRGAYQRGHRVCRLWTHSRTGALELYERVGMSVARSSTVFVRVVGGLG